MTCLQVVRGTNVTNGFPRHVHQKFCVGVVQQGTRVVSQAGKSVVIPENALFVINPGVAHICGSQGKAGHSYLTLCVEPEMMQQIASQISEKAQPLPVFREVPLFDSELFSMVRHLGFLVERSDSTLHKESALTSMLATLITRYGDAPPIPRRMGAQRRAIDRVCQYLEAYFIHNPSLEELSGVACLSPFHFHRLFLKNIGVSPHEYLMQLRIKKARELLPESDSIASVALELGFADQSHFTRNFKRLIGITPGRFMQIHKDQVWRHRI